MAKIFNFPEFDPETRQHYTEVKEELVKQVSSMIPRRFHLDLFTSSSSGGELFMKQEKQTDSASLKTASFRGRPVLVSELTGPVLRLILKNHHAQQERANALIKN